MPTKCCWVIHGSLTSERKASTSPSSFSNHSILLLNRALKRQAPCLYIDMHFEVRALRTRRRFGSARRRGNHMHDHSRFQRDINDVTGVSLSLSLPLTKVTHAQYRKRFRASYNSFSDVARRRCTRVKVIRVEVSQNVVHARTTGWMTSTLPGKLRDFGLQPRGSNPRSRNLLWALGVKSTWFLNFGGQAKCKLVLVVDSWPSLVVFGVVIPLWVKKHE